MPRATAASAKLATKRTPPSLITRRIYPKDGDGPRLWNAKRRIRTSKGLAGHQAIELMDKNTVRQWKVPEKYREWKQSLDEEQLNTPWWKLDKANLKNFIEAHSKLRTLSSDVKDFIVAGSINFERSTILGLLRNPPKHFSVPCNVPHSMRKQVYFPDPKEAVVLMRTPHLGPRYAAFDVPLHFNKIDLRAYLKDVYNVDVLHIRSVVLQQKVDRKEGRDRWEYDDYWTSMKAVVSRNREDSEWGMHNPDVKHRKALAVQAQQLLKGKMRWAPTWQNFADDWRAMHGLEEGASQQPSQEEQPPV